MEEKHLSKSSAQSYAFLVKTPEFVFKKGPAFDSSRPLNFDKYLENKRLFCKNLSFC